MPHVTEIPSTPKSSGCELKAACDCQSNVMQRAEIEEGKDAMASKEYTDRFPQHTAGVLRLAKPWFGSCRIILGVSAFASFTTAMALLLHELFFIGIIKTCTKYFPNKLFKAFEGTNPARGEVKVMRTTTTVNGDVKPVVGCGWMIKMIKFFVFTCGTTLAGNPHNVEYSRKVTKNGVWDTEKYLKTTPRPSLVEEELFDGSNVIDVHDHYRQGTLHMEGAWHTKTWWHRIFCTMLGVTITDCRLTAILRIA
jgi:hypothetical protein